MLQRRRLLASALAAGLPAAAIRPAPAQATARVSLIHLNDFHSRHEGAEASGGGCRDGRPCLGGSARLVGAVKAARVRHLQLRDASKTASGGNSFGVAGGAGGLQPRS